MSYQFLSIIHEARDIARQEAARRIEACPNDGEPVEQGPRGQFHCPFCGLKFDSPTGRSDGG